MKKIITVYNVNDAEADEKFVQHLVVYLKRIFQLNTSLLIHENNATGQIDRESEKYGHLGSFSNYEQIENYLNEQERLIVLLKKGKVDQLFIDLAVSSDFILVPTNINAHHYKVAMKIVSVFEREINVNGKFISKFLCFHGIRINNQVDVNAFMGYKEELIEQDINTFNLFFPHLKGKPTHKEETVIMSFLFEFYQKIMKSETYYTEYNEQNG